VIADPTATRRGDKDMRRLSWVLILLMSLMLVFAGGCADDDDDDSGADDDTSSADDDDDDDDNDDNDDNDDDNDDNNDDNDDDDDDDDTTPEGIPTFSRFVTANDSPLPGALESCAVYRQTQCVENVVQRCAIYDGADESWLDDPDPFLEQMYNYDRYYDLYHRMEGQLSDYEFTQPMPPGTPEEVWGDPQYFRKYSGYGDSGGWTATALHAAAARYAVTGSDADYQRMLEHFEQTAFQYEATDIPGMMMRSHFAMLEEGAPLPTGLQGKAVTTYSTPAGGHFLYPLAQEYVDRLPAYYTDGVDILGTHYDTVPRWQGDASRDMYVRGLPAVLLAYDLLEAKGPREDHLRQVIQTEIPCTLNRMKKMRVVNLQSNQVLVQALLAYLGTGRLLTDPGDIDITQIDTIIGYVMEQPHPEHMEEFDATCPDGPPTEIDPEFDLDAGNFVEFVIKFSEMVERLTGGGDNPIAWMMAPSVNGGEEVFMTQWALAAHYLTGDERYLDFVAQMQQETDYWPVINLMGSFFSPKWCRPHFGPSLLYPSLWNMQNRVDREVYPEYWANMAVAIAEEERGKDLLEANDFYFGILYETMVDEAADPDAADYAEEMAGTLVETRQFGVADRNEPRRNYSVDWRETQPPGVEIETLSDDEYHMCMDPVTLFGIPVWEGWIEDEYDRATEGMPIEYRVPNSFIWTSDPFMLYRSYGSDSAKQWPPVAFTVAYWSARLQGSIDIGTDTALAWRDTGDPCP
jgi:hypothetical protein